MSIPGPCPMSTPNRPSLQGDSSLTSRPQNEDSPTSVGPKSQRNPRHEESLYPHSHPGIKAVAATSQPNRHARAKMSATMAASTSRNFLNSRSSGEDIGGLSVSYVPVSSACPSCDASFESV